MEVLLETDVHAVERVQILFRDVDHHDLAIAVTLQKTGNVRTAAITPTVKLKRQTLRRTAATITAARTPQALGSVAELRRSRDAFRPVPPHRQDVPRRQRQEVSARTGSATK